MKPFEHKKITNDLQQLIKNFAGEAFVLDSQVDSRLQLKYFSMATSIRGRYGEKNLPQLKRKLWNESTGLDLKRELIAGIASVASVKGLRILENYQLIAPAGLTDWVKLAVLENKFILHSLLADVPPILIATGLGGKGTRLRYFLAFFSRNEHGFEQWQQQLIKGEVEFALMDKGELEQIVFWNDFVRMDLLLELKVDVKQWASQLIDICNEMGNFLLEDHIITNIRTFDESQLKAYRKKNISALQSPAIRR